MRMRLDIENFDVDFKKISRLLDIRLVDVVNRSALGLWRDVILHSPVDTGRFRASWTISLGEVPKLKSFPKFVRKNRNSKILVYPAPNPNEGNESISKSDLSKPIWIGNSVEYGVFLEKGHSKQAPLGIIRLAVANLQAQFERIVKAVRDANIQEQRRR